MWRFPMGSALQINWRQTGKVLEQGKRPQGQAWEEL